MPGTDLHAELLKTKKRSKTKQDINIDLSLDYKLDKINSDRIFHISDIKKICIDYRLRFLDFELFKGKVPDEAYKNLKSFYSDHKEIKREIKMMAPSSLFQLDIFIKGIYSKNGYNISLDTLDFGTFKQFLVSKSNKKR